MESLKRMLGLKKGDAAAAPHDPGHSDGFGAQSIGLLGSLCLVTNNIMGPGMMSLSLTFQQTGWVMTGLAFLLVSWWTTQSALFLSRCMASFRGNGTFSRRLEFGNVAYHLLPRWAYYLCMATLTLVFTGNNIANIVMTSQVMDEMVLEINSKTCALVLSASSADQAWSCVTGDNDATVTDSLFGSDYVITVGYIITLLAAIPLSLWNLDNTIGVQIAGMFLTVVCVIVWVVQFCSLGLQPSYLPAFGDGVLSYTSVLSTVLFNYGFVCTIPSWLNEKALDVSATKTIWGGQLLASAQYLLFAVFGALAMDFSSGADAISLIDSGNVPGMWEVSKIMTYVFPIANILTSIPVFSIIVRYNILQIHGVKVPLWLANIVSVLVPWVLAIPAYTGNSLNTLLTWASAVMFVLMNLIFPIGMYIASERMLADGKVPDIIEDAAAGEGEGDSDGVKRRLLDSELDSATATPVSPVKGIEPAVFVERRTRSFGPGVVDAASEVFSLRLAVVDDKDLESELLLASGGASRIPSINAATTTPGMFHKAHDPTEAEDIHAVFPFLRACMPEFWHAVGLLGISVVLWGLTFGLQVYAGVTGN